jgi:hypothetical protein
MIREFNMKWEQEEKTVDVSFVRISNVTTVFVLTSIRLPDKNGGDTSRRD